MIYVTGDTHGDYDIHKLNSTNFPEGLRLTKEDYVIVLGDFGVLWKDCPNQTEVYWLNWLKDKPWTTLFLDGNHENFKRINLLKQIKMFNGTVGKVSSSVYHLKRGEVYTIHGQTFLTIGGAESIDRIHRTENISWWPQELISYQEQEYIIDQIEKYPKVDYVLSHTCPSFIHDKLHFWGGEKKEDPTMKILSEVFSRLHDFKHWYFGHFHEDMTIDDKFTCVYQLIREI